MIALNVHTTTMRGPVVAIAAVMALLLVLTTVTMFAMSTVMDDGGDIELTVEGTLDGEAVTGTLVIEDTNESSRASVLRATATMVVAGGQETLVTYIMLGEDGLPDPDYCTYLGEREVGGVATQVWGPASDPGYGFCFDGTTIVGMVITVGGYDCIATRRRRSAPAPRARSSPPRRRSRSSSRRAPRSRSRRPRPGPGI